MGISGLLPLLKDVQRQRNIKEYAGQTLGIDAYVWLHRGAYGCAAKLAMGEHTTSYVNYAMARIRMLQHWGVTPFVVFDGDRLPAKARTEAERALRRTESRQQAETMLEQGKTKQAYDVFAKCVDVTPEMAYQLIKALRTSGVDYIVAPYEADAQLAYLEKEGTIAGVITEDSDLLVFGCKTVLYKLDIDGSCIEIKQERLTSCKALPMGGFTMAQFRQMAILSGCDYLESVPGMGIKTAHRLLRKFNTVPKVIQAMKMEGKRVPVTYAADFETAERTFVYQRVFKRDADGSVCQVTLTGLSNLDDAERAAAESYECIGAPIKNDEARAIADGNIDPISRLPIVDLTPNDVAKPAAAPPKASTSFYRKLTKPAATKDPRQPGLKNFFSKQQLVARAPSSRKPLRESSGCNSPSSSKTVVEMITLKRKLVDSDDAASGSGDAPILVSPPRKVKSRFFAAATECSSSQGLVAALNDDMTQVETPKLQASLKEAFMRRGAPQAAVGDTEMTSSSAVPGNTGVHVGFILPSAARSAPSLSPANEHDGLISSPASTSVCAAPSSPPLLSMDEPKQQTTHDERDEEDDHIDEFASPTREVRKVVVGRAASVSSRLSCDPVEEEEEVQEVKPTIDLAAQLRERFAYAAASPHAKLARSSTTPNLVAATKEGSFDPKTPRSRSIENLLVENEAGSSKRPSTVKRRSALNFSNVAPVKSETLQRRGASMTTASTLKLNLDKTPTVAAPARPPLLALASSSKLRKPLALDIAPSRPSVATTSPFLNTFKFNAKK